MEYFSFINLFLLFLFIIISLFFILIHSTLLYYSTIHFNHSTIEFISTLFSLLFLILIISPALIILMDYDLIIIPSYIIYSLGLQWAWQFNIMFQPVDIGFDSYCDHYIISMVNRNVELSQSSFDFVKLLELCGQGHLSMAIAAVVVNYLLLPSNSYIDMINNDNNSKCSSSINNNLRGIMNRKLSKSIMLFKIKIDESIITKYLFDISQYILLPLYSFVRLFVYSFDVIHTLGIYSWGIKIDAIPGRINLATTLRLLNKGEYRGKCFELCGQGHLSMAISAIVT